MLGPSAPGPHVIGEAEIKFFSYDFRLRWFRPCRLDRQRVPGQRVDRLGHCDVGIDDVEDSTGGGPHPRHLGQHLVHPVQGVLLLQLVGQIGDHATGYLVDLDPRIDTGIVAFELVVLLADLTKIKADFLQCLQVQAGVVIGIAQCRHHTLGGRVRGTAGKGGNRRVNVRAAVLDGLELAHFRGARSGMTVQMNRQFHGIAKRGVLVRHLVMPNDLANTAEVMRFLAEELSPDTYINIMAQYHVDYRAAEHERIARAINAEEFLEAMDWAEEAGLRALGEAIDRRGWPAAAFISATRFTRTKRTSCRSISALFRIGLLK